MLSLHIVLENCCVPEYPMETNLPASPLTPPPHLLPSQKKNYLHTFLSVLCSWRYTLLPHPLFLEFQFSYKLSFTKFGFWDPHPLGISSNPPWLDMDIIYMHEYARLLMYVARCNRKSRFARLWKFMKTWVVDLGLQFLHFQVHSISVSEYFLHKLAWYN